MEPDAIDSRLVIRALRPDDLDRLVRMDQAHSGRNRRQWLEGKLGRALGASDVTVSLGAEWDGTLVGALMASVQYGEFGVAEPVAVLDTLLVDRDMLRRGIGTELVEQLVKNLGALRVERIRTEVAWDEQDIVGLFARCGFAPAARIVLERPV